MLARRKSLSFQLRVFSFEVMVVFLFLATKRDSTIFFSVLVCRAEWEFAPIIWFEKCFSQSRWFRF